MSNELHHAINAQINAELWSAYLYLAMSLDAEAKGHKGVANWFFIQFKEEQDHARIFMNYLNSRDCKVVLEPIAPVPSEWGSVLEMFQQIVKSFHAVWRLITVGVVLGERFQLVIGHFLYFFVGAENLFFKALVEKYQLVVCR